MKNLQRLGIICSSGGSALAAASQCLEAIGINLECVIATDRPCGIENWAILKGHQLYRISYSTAEQFSNDALSIFKNQGCENVLLFFTKRVSFPLIDNLFVWNIHPALLPAFKGLHGIRDSVDAGVRIMGATLHRVDAGLDTGEIYAQVAAPLPFKKSMGEVNHISYLQKVWLTLVWYDTIFNHGIQPCSDICGEVVMPSSPGLRNRVIYSSFAKFLEFDKQVAAKK
jgi:folate-dependent phosphoribosylglycinamide formyltransferase PurN